MSNPTVLLLSDVLYEYDPAGTCCKENQCGEEYDSIAESIIESDLLLTEAVRSVFSEYFELELTESIVDGIVADFNKAVEVQEERRVANLDARTDDYWSEY